MNIDLSKGVNLRPYTRLEIEVIYNTIGVDLSKKEPNEDGWVICKSPLRVDKNPSFGIQLETGNWVDHGTSDHGNIEEAVKQYHDIDYNQAVKVIRDVLSPLRGNGATNIDRQTSEKISSYNSISGDAGVDDFWNSDRLEVREQSTYRLNVEADNEVVKHLKNYDQIDYQTLLKYNCGITEHYGEDYIVIPYSTGAQLYRRSSNNEKVVRNLPGSKVKRAFFGTGEIKFTKRLHLCKSPRETMLLSQFLKDDCIGICSGENTQLGEEHKQFLYSLFQKGCNEVFIYFDCDTPEAKENARAISESVKGIHTEAKVWLVDIHKASHGADKDLTDWLREGKTPQELLEIDHQEIAAPVVSDDLRDRFRNLGKDPSSESKNAGPVDKPSYQPFWKVDKKGKVTIHHKRFIDMLETYGFMKIYIDGFNPMTVRKQEHIISQVNQSLLNDFVRSHVDTLPDHLLDSDDLENLREEILEAYYNKASSLTSDQNQQLYRKQELDFLTDEKDCGYLFFKNGVVKVTEKKSKLIPYSELKGDIWRDQIIKRDIAINPDEADQAVFANFVQKLSRGKPKRLKALKSSLGYLMHTYKNKSQAKAIVLVDEKLVDSIEEAHGGTGKSLFVKSLSHVRKYRYIQGKNFQPSHRFSFQGVNIGDQVLLIDDVRPDFDFEGLFNVITDDMAIEQKHKNQKTIDFKYSPKIAVTTNTAIGGNGNSFSRRQNIVEFPDYFNADRTVDGEFGHIFFDEWDDAEWNKFYNYMISCLQFFLQNGLINFTSNYKKKKLIVETSRELVEFYEQEIQPDVEYDKNVLHEKFIQHREYINQARFTMHLKKCGDADNRILDVKERKSGAFRFIEFVSKKKSTS